MLVNYWPIFVIQVPKLNCNVEIIFLHLVSILELYFPSLLKTAHNEHIPFALWMQSEILALFSFKSYINSLRINSRVALNIGKPQ